MSYKDVDPDLKPNLFVPFTTTRTDNKSSTVITAQTTLKAHSGAGLPSNLSASVDDAGSLGFN
jgi:hypothetical protein